MTGRIGVYICSCVTNISDVVDVEEVARFATQFPGVVYAKVHSLLCSEEGKAFLSEDIQKEQPDRIVIAACSPKEHEHTFRKVLAANGLNPYLLQMANIREQVAWVTADPDEATAKAKSYLKAALQRIPLHEPLPKQEIECNPNALVIGAGPAGMEAALMLARAGRKVYLVEKNPFIGGKAVLYEEVFPNLECATCMLEPKMDEVLHHENIELFTLSEVQEVRGFIGNFTVKIRKHPRYVAADKSIGCGACFEACPVSAKNEFNFGLNNRRAVFTPFAGTLPNVPVIDRQNCLRFRGEECTRCQEACPFGAIDYDDRELTVERNVGAIVVATGFDLCDLTALPAYGYGKIPDVFTSLEFERLLAATGPTEGKIIRQNSKKPKSVAIIHCVGSRNKKEHAYCSAVCCLYAAKFNHLIKKKLPQASVFHLYTDWCLPGKNNHTLFDTFKGKTCTLRVSSPQTIKVKRERDQIAITYQDPSGTKNKLLTEMVVLCPAMVASQGTAAIASVLSLPQGKGGFLSESHTKLGPVATTTEGVYIAGCAQGPKNIEESVAQGAAAAGAILAALVPGKKLELEATTVTVDPERCGGCGICIALCPYGALGWDGERKAAAVNQALCKGCGTCAAACPSRALKSRHFTTEEIYAEIEALVE
ncbi:CoB--CoM heterodisulfide reductase iron-sulfur subunit A family protein [Thermodesulfitimonas autotrophica]|uniref:CoB--CoM heterodisulfide reductase iron-sulfur subunit A family protein n=1 Tax=Thermodesulfitimonas autotrophica TaxID=1894989 RepID=UPI002FE250B2